jgi:hypothetical protein
MIGRGLAALNTRIVDVVVAVEERQRAFRECGH